MRCLFGAGRRWLNGGGPAEYVLGGWQINGINTFQTGLSFTPTLNAATITTGTGSRPDRVGDGALASPTVDRWFDTAAFATPAAFTYGDAGRNILYGPGRVNVDFSLFKEFRITEALKLQFRGECFNLFNTPRFDLPALMWFRGRAVRRFGAWTRSRPRFRRRHRPRPPC